MKSYNVAIYISEGNTYRHALTEGFPTLALATRFAEASFAIGDYYPYKVIHSVKVFECTVDGGPELCHLGKVHN